MISDSLTTLQRPEAWQQLQAQAIRDPAELINYLNLPSELIPAAQAAAAQFPLRVPSPYLNRIRRGDPHDPLLRQVLPLDVELDEHPGFHPDPVGDHAAMRAPGVLNKYAGRVLLITTGACAVHCRYCFRRHFPYAESHAAHNQWQTTLQAIASDTSLNEVILSGGDPLSLSDSRLMELIDGLQAIPHLKRLRIHTRLPVVIPHRVTEDLLVMLTSTRLQPVMVIHSNHPNELDAVLRRALADIRQAGITLLNQAVLLRGVNDSVETLAALSETLFESGVLPYYLHQLDKVEGAHHFLVEVNQARELYESLRQRLPGYLLPRLVQEIPGMAAKLPL